jgi:amino acid adenylation domain-containing protein
MEETFTKAIGILNLAKENDVDVILNGDMLQLKIPKGKTIDKVLLEKLGANKKLIIDYLSNENLRLTIVSNSNQKINSFNRDDINRIPLSFSQERLWFIDRLEGSVQYHLPVVLRLKGRLEQEALSKAISDIVKRHEILRTVYKEENGQVFQWVKPVGNWQLSEHDGRKYSGNKEKLETYIRELIQKPFNLSEDDMLRAELIGFDSEDHILVVTMHHIASDATSMPVLVREVSALYSGYVSGKAASLSSLPLQYADYAVWQRDNIQGSFLEEKLKYWKEKLEGVSPLQLPADYSRRAEGGMHGSTLFFDIAAELSHKVQALGHQHGATLYMTLLTAFKVLLHRYSGQEDFCVGTSVANRPQQELEGLIGYFVNTLALRDKVRGDMSFIELLQDVKATTLGAYRHQQVPFEKVVEVVVKERQTGLSPLFQVMLVLINTPEVPELKLGELRLTTENLEQTTSKFDLTFFIKESKSGFRGSVQYNANLYSKERIQRMTSHFCGLLQSVVSSPEIAVGELEILSLSERRALLGYGQSESAYPAGATIADLFEEQARLRTDNAAVIFARASISYKELNLRANQLAHRLQLLGVKEDTLVPLYTERGIDMLIGILGILKAGAAYVPIDTEYPEERVSYMLEDTRAAVAVSSGEYANRLQQFSGSFVEVVETDRPNEGAAITNPKRNLKPSHLAYVIYTSGSTGKPKGVQVSHRNVVDYVYGLNERTGISECKSYALVSTIATDLGNTVLYSSLLYGGTLHLFSRETVSHIEELHEYFEKHKIDCLKIVPSHWKALSPEDGAPLLPGRMLIFGGEAFPLEQAARIRRYSKDCRVFNHYGPTETTIGKLIYELAEDYSGKVIPIGKPFSNTKVYVLSKELVLCPIGVPGQLYIAGEGVASGYLNRADLTAEKFLLNPYGEEGERMYGTGDRVQYEADGNIIFIGRVDDQVKIRGYRVEPGEVGRILEESQQVEQAIVLAREDKQGNMQLVGYIVPRGEFDKSGLQAYLMAQLPEYMVPAHLIELSSLPLTANGKIDRKALPNPEGSLPKGGYVPPRNEGEAKLAAIWQDVLEVDKVGIEDDFFELGGHSLLAIRLISAIQKAFGIELPINDVFVYPTIAGLIGRIQPENKTTAESENETSFNSLIPIKNTGNKMPLYIVCGSGGTVLKFAKFAKMLDSEQPVYGLQQPTDSKYLKGLSNTAGAIAEMYIKELIMQNPYGPYALSGHCAGGKIAFEMAMQLKAMGKKVSMLAMFDVYVKDVEEIPVAKPNNYYHIPDIIKKSFFKILLKTEFEFFLLSKHPKQALQYKIEKLKSIMGVNRTKPGEIEIEFNKVTRVFKIASRNYQMRYYEGEVLVFHAEDHHYFTDWNKGILFKKIGINNDNKYAWKKYARSVKNYEVKGEHSTMFVPENAKEFSRILQQHLNESVIIDQDLLKVAN